MVKLNKSLERRKNEKEEKSQTKKSYQKIWRRNEIDR